MIKEEDFAGAAEVSSEMAFVRLERKFRAVYQNNLNDSRSNEAYYDYTREYLNHTVAAAETLGFSFLSNFDVEADNNELVDIYSRLITAVDRFAVKVQIQYIRQPPQNTVTLEGSEKRILRHYVAQIKDVIDQSSLIVAKKERLFDRINSFLEELDRDRTALQKFNDIVISLSHTGGEAAEELEPTWKWVKLIAALLGARQENEQAKLPKPTAPKKLEPPKEELPTPKVPPKRKSEIDDDIPF
jgi:hypothetical protein